MLWLAGRCPDVCFSIYNFLVNFNNTAQLSSTVLASVSDFDPKPRPSHIIGCTEHASYILGLGGTVWKVDHLLTPRKPYILANVQQIIQISCGVSHSLLLDFFGNVWSMGSGVSGKLGHGDSFTRMRPKRIESLPVITYIGAGGGHSCFVDEDDSLWVTGLNDSGQLGLGTTQSCDVPMKVDGLCNVKTVQCGSNHTIILTEFSSCWVTGANSEGQLGLGNVSVQYSFVSLSKSIFTDISCGMNHSIFLDSKGRVFSCGDNQFGQLGLGKKKDRAFYTSLNRIRDIPPISQISSLQNHSICIDEEGTAWVFGKNNFGQLGLFHQKDQPSPQPLPGKYTLLCNGLSDHTILINDYEVETAFGRNDKFQLGIQCEGEIVCSPIQWEDYEHIFAPLDTKSGPCALAVRQSHRFQYVSISEYVRCS